MFYYIYFYDPRKYKMLDVLSITEEKHCILKCVWKTEQTFHGATAKDHWLKWKIIEFL